MPFREKAKNLFRPRSKTTSSTASSTANTSSSSGSLYHTSTHDTLASLSESLSRWPSNVYKPGEPMPRPKYRAIPKPEHTARLQAFQFSDAWATGRRNSGMSQYSPMGTRAPSRRTSVASLAAAADGTTAATTRANSSLFSMTDEGARSNSLTSFETGDVSGASSSSARSCAGVPAKTAPDVQMVEDIGAKAS